MTAVLLTLVVMANSANANVVAHNHDRTAPPNYSSAERIARAQSTHNKIFVAYVVVLALTVIGTYFVWSSGNAAQGAIQDASNAETELAKQKASEADARAKVAEESAGRANVRASEIEESNLILRSQIGNLEIQASDAKKDVARLEKDAADARATQQRVEAQLAVQQEKAAVAERSLLELQERIKPRRLTDKQALDFVEALKAISPATIDFGYTSGAGD